MRNVVVLMMAEMLCAASRFMHAIARHHTPAELECNDGHQQVKKSTDHEFSIAQQL